MKEHSGSLRVYPHIVVDLVHRLAYANSCSQMKDDIHSVNGFSNRIEIAYISQDELRIWREIGRHFTAVNLRREVIEHSDVVTSFDQSIGQM